MVTENPTANATPSAPEVAPQSRTRASRLPAPAASAEKGEKIGKRVAAAVRTLIGWRKAPRPQMVADDLTKHAAATAEAATSLRLLENVVSGAKSKAERDRLPSVSVSLRTGDNAEGIPSAFATREDSGVFYVDARADIWLAMLRGDRLSAATYKRFA